MFYLVLGLRKTNADIPRLSQNSVWEEPNDAPLRYHRCKVVPATTTEKDTNQKHRHAFA